MYKVLSLFSGKVGHKEIKYVLKGLGLSQSVVYSFDRLALDSYCISVPVALRS